MRILVADTTVVSHFARAGHLITLERLVGGHRFVTPEGVQTEIRRGIAEHPSLGMIASAGWVEVVALDSLDEVTAFARFKGELGGGPDRNNGEAEVLAWVSVHGGTAIIDERSGTNIALREGLDVHGTLWLIVSAHLRGLLDAAGCEDLVDDLVETDMALPVGGDGFFDWASKWGLLS